MHAARQIFTKAANAIKWDAIRDNIGSQLHETWFEAELKQTIFDNKGNCHMIFEIIQCRE